ncbi:MAG: dihydroxyacetone kinase subunit L [Betaproteobacteria bacterium AqS2]|uniref:Dihydroxyacetone kinase subunit L n=1 Tax=Candidatus Amphirhobacter heronislandensis TaxID=1732024 RepID=A0A930UI66_9GAMM|nr:dihydroxyacetone kinase subunit L [Betaproteobacteria bacterium AqS2]
MSGGLDRAALVAGAKAVAARMEACGDEINEADAKLGDGDLGVTMTRGMGAIVAEADALPADVGMALLACSKCFTRISGSSFGTLVATGLMAMAKACKGREEVPWAEASALLAAACEAMRKRGKAELGAKTVLDSLAAMAAAMEGKDAPGELAAAARDAAGAALEEFRGRQNKLGRARMYGEKSKGLDDPGMLVALRVAEGLAPPADG